MAITECLPQTDAEGITGCQSGAQVGKYNYVEKRGTSNLKLLPLAAIVYMVAKETFNYHPSIMKKYKEM